MGGSIPKERHIKICCYYFPLFRRKMLFIGHNNKVFYKHILQEKKYFDGIKLAWEIFFILRDNTPNSWCIVLNMAYKAFITYPACGATIPCSQKLKFSVLFFRYNAYIKLNREICNELLISCTSN